MTFADPLWLAAGLAACLLLAALFVAADRRRRRALASFAAGHLLPGLTASLSPARRRAKRALQIAGVALVFAALARPQLGFHWEEARQRGVDVLFLIDTSKSMLSQDVKPDRLTRAKLAVEDLAARLDGDRLGLIAFAGEAFLQCPLTLDAGAFRESVEALDTATIPRGGTDIASALREAVLAFRAEGDKTKIAVLLTDGEDLEGSALDAAREAAKAGLKVYTIGVGTPAGDLIPAPDGQGGTQFLRDAGGNFVKSRLDEARLRQIAEATGGSYQPLGARGEGLDLLLQTTLAPLPRDKEETRMTRVPHERFAWPLALGLALLLAEPLVGTRRRGRPSPAPGGAAAAAVLLVLLLLPGALRASPAAGEKAFEKGDFPRAEAEYERAVRRDDRPELQFNVGAAAYKNQRFDKAAEAFQKALKADGLDVQQHAYYNYGDTLYRLGQKTEKENPQQAMGAWQKAIEAYDGALKLRPDDPDAKFNRDFVAKKLQELQKKNPQDSKSKDQKQQEQKDQKDQKNQSQSPSSSKENQGQGQGDQNKPQPGGQPQNQSPPSSGQKPEGQPSNPEQKPGEEPKPEPSKKEDPKAPQPQPGEERKGEEGQGQGQAAAPGEMTPEDAKNLLDSLRSGERKLPLNGKGEREEQPPQKDW